MPPLLCPLCRGEVATASSGCLTCHLPMLDVLRHQRTVPSRARSVGRAVRIRVIGLVAYVGVVLWCSSQLPDTLPFVVPGAVMGGGVLHVWKGRPWLGLAAFLVIVVAVPALLWPSMLTGAFFDVTNS